ncbi:MAG: glycosyltransferase family 2 protein [Vicinamibacterales bacterium]
MSRALDASPLEQADPAAIAFVIPVRDDAERLRTCLRSLREVATATPHDVLVLDHGSVDASAAVARAAGARVMTRRGGNVAALRNLGAASTSAPLIAFIDADNEVAAGWLGSALGAFKAPSVGIAGAPYFAPPQGTWVQRTYDALRRHPSTDGPTEWLGAGNMVIRRQAFDAAGGFDERLETCEDVDLCVRVARAGWDVRAVPGMKSVHHGDPARLSHVFWGELWRGRDNLRVTLRGPRSFRTLASAAMPVAYAGAVVASLAGWLAGWPAGAVIAGTGLVGLLALLALRVSTMRRNAGGRLPAGLWAAVRVALAYDLGRAAAVFVGVGHGRRREAASK